MSLQNIPVDLYELVIQHLKVQDLSALSLVSGRCRESTLPQLYKDIRVTKPDKSLFIGLLLGIIRRKEMSMYIKRITIDIGVPKRPKTYGLAPYPPLGETPRKIEPATLQAYFWKSLRLFQDAIDDMFPLMHPEEKFRCLSDLQSLEDGLDSCVALLIHLARNLTYLSMSKLLPSTYSNHWYFTNLVLNPVDTINPHTERHLPGLQELELTGCNKIDERSLEHELPLSISMSVLRARDMKVSGLFWLNRPVPLMWKLQVLELRNVHIQPADLQNIILSGSLGALQELKVHGSVGFGPWHDLISRMAGLLETETPLLRILVIELGIRFSEETIGSLRGLKHLIHLQLDIGLFLRVPLEEGESDNSFPLMYALLPNQLEYLGLSDTCAEFLKDLIKFSEHIPSLLWEMETGNVAPCLRRFCMYRSLFLEDDPFSEYLQEDSISSRVQEYTAAFRRSNVSFEVFGSHEECKRRRALMSAETSFIWNYEADPPRARSEDRLPFELPARSGEESSDA